MISQFTLEQWLAYIENLNPRTIVLGLERVAEIAKKLNLTQFTIPVITVAGTNGKGSTVAFTEAILLAAGYRVGAYTSPHLLKFNERIRINGQAVTDEILLTAFLTIENARENTPLTYFEFTTLAALSIFKEAGLDFLVLEVGLGGRLDAVNIVDPDIAVVTNIALDHMEWLGATREEIGIEKAGIFRPHRLAVYGDPNPINTVMNLAAQNQVELYCVKRDFNYEIVGQHWYWQSEKEKWVDLPIPYLPLANAATSLMVISLLRQRYKISQEAIHQGLLSAYLPGRFQMITHPIHCILDVAHNPAAAVLLAQRLRSLPKMGKTIALVSILADKDIAGTLMPLLPLVDAWHVSGLPVPRGASTQILLSQLQALGAKELSGYNSLLEAWSQAVKTCGSNDRVLVFGSFYTVGAVLNFLNQKEQLAANI